MEHILGDGEGGIEMTESMQLIREFCNRLIVPEKARQTRIVSSLIFDLFSFSRQITLVSDLGDRNGLVVPH